MVQLNILSGKKAGSHVIARRFPFSIGRLAGSALQLDDEGVWDKHLTLEFKRHDGYYLAKATNAMGTVNEQVFDTVRLHNGDTFTCGSAKLQFWLAAARQRGLRFRETAVWAVILAISALQLVLVYWLTR